MAIIILFTNLKFDLMNIYIVITKFDLLLYLYMHRILWYKFDKFFSVDCGFYGLWGLCLAFWLVIAIISEGVVLISCAELDS